MLLLLCLVFGVMAMFSAVAYAGFDQKWWAPLPHDLSLRGGMALFAGHLIGIFAGVGAAIEMGEEK